jgi:hypothetical protein
MSGAILIVGILSMLSGSVYDQIFTEDFSTPQLDPAWQVVQTVPGLGGYSLTDNPGYLRYYLTGWLGYSGGWTLNYQSIGWTSSLTLLRQFDGENWILRTKADYNLHARDMNTGNSTGVQGQKLFIALGEETNDYLYIYRAVDWWYSYNALVMGLVSNGVEVAHFDGVPSPIGIDGWARETYLYEITRNGQEITVRFSNDGINYATAFSASLTEPVTATQRAIIDMCVYLPFGSYVDWDYIHVEPGNQLPVALCRDIIVPAGEQCQAEVTPEAIDNGSYDPDGDEITLRISPKGPFDIGVHEVILTVTDHRDAQATCTAKVTVVDSTKPISSFAVLPVLSGECSVDVVAVPTAIDNCAGVISGTTENPRKYTEQGTYTINWSYDDTHGNIEFQTQTVIVRDTTPPVPDVASLPTNSDQCSIEITTIPTATDICDGKIIGTTNDPLQYTNQGAYTIHWTYTDGAGNVSTQNQSVIIKNTTAPTINVSAPECVTYGKGNGNKANKITVTGQDNCSKSVIPQITKVEVFNNGGNLVTGNGIYEISGNTVYVNPSGNGWSVRITVFAEDENGNNQTIPITKSLIKC